MRGDTATPPHHSRRAYPGFASPADASRNMTKNEIAGRRRRVTRRLSAMTEASAPARDLPGWCSFQCIERPGRCAQATTLVACREGSVGSRARLAVPIAACCYHQAGRGGPRPRCRCLSSPEACCPGSKGRQIRKASEPLADPAIANASLRRGQALRHPMRGHPAQRAETPNALRSHRVRCPTAPIARRSARPTGPAPPYRRFRHARPARPGYWRRAAATSRRAW